jgi:hypothetical protein
MNESKLKILCVEDDEDTCELISFSSNKQAMKLKPAAEWIA